VTALPLATRRSTLGSNSPASVRECRSFPHPLRDTVATILLNQRGANLRDVLPPCALEV
jgi:hypothetical protein